MARDPFYSDPNLYRYVHNSHANAVDPAGLADIRLVSTVNGPFEVNPALARSNLFGSRWRWQWDPRDAWSIAQKVTVNGTFSMQVCGKSGNAQGDGFMVSNYEVAWKEEYIEVWTRGGTTQENHTARPAGPAGYLAEQGGFTFSPIGNSLFIVKDGQKMEVEEWHFAMTGKFEVVNGFYPQWNAAIGGFYTSANKFEITRLMIDGVEKPPAASKMFNRMLYPGLRKPEVPGFPAPQTIGRQLTCDENWILNREKGHKPKSNYGAPSYK